MTIANYSYTGGGQSFIVPSCVYRILIDISGAEGEANNGGAGKGNYPLSALLKAAV